jgi:L-galactose dehydrogenase/L-glyceraldehyde 3-phosphate reductase
MRKNWLGRTGLEVSEIAFGGGVTGGILIKADEPTRISALMRAVEAGINLIDTAPLYGGGASEEAIGRHLAALEPRPYVSTKVLIGPDDLMDIRGAIERSLEQSLKRLQLERVALLQLHNQIGTAIGDRPPLSTRQVLGAVADTFDRLKEQGLIRAGGMTAAGDTAACLEVINSGRFDCAQVYYNAINPSAAWSRAPKIWTMQDFSGVIRECFNQHMGILNIRVWAGGPLASATRPENLAVFASGTDVDNEMHCANLIRKMVGDSHGTAAQTALRFVLGNRDVTTRVIGISELAQINEAVAAVEKGPLPSQAISRLEGLWATNFK